MSDTYPSLPFSRAATLDAGPAMDIEIADRVLKREGPFKIDERGVARGEWNAEVPLFSTADAIAVMYVLPKLREKCDILMLTSPKTSVWHVELNFGTYRGHGTAPGLALAICRAALDLADAMNLR